MAKKAKSKRAPKKTKTPARTPKRALKDRRLSRKPKSSFGGPVRLSVRSGTQKVVDDLLLRLSPNVQSQLDKLSKMVETNSMSVNELKTIGYKVLQKAMEVSNSLKNQTGFSSKRKPKSQRR